MTLDDLLGKVLDVGTNTLQNAANKAVLGTDAAGKIALRQEELTNWAGVSGVGPNDKVGAARDAAQGDIYSRNPFGTLIPQGGAQMLLLVLAGALLVVLIARKL